MVCRLSLLGPPRLLDNQGSLISVPAKAYALIAYLVLTSRGEPATRASLRQFLWEDSDPKAAATNMRKFLSRVVERQEKFGFELIRSRRDHVELAKTIQIDLAEFLRIVSHRSSADLVTLCDIYRGDLLEGCELEGTEVQDWLIVQRANVRDAFVSAIANSIEPPDSGADRVAVRIAARRLLEVDPYNEVGHRALMRLFAEEGEPARIRDIYLSLTQRLSEDLGVEPDQTTTELFHALLPARTSPPAAAAGRAMRSLPSPTRFIPKEQDAESVQEDTAAPSRTGVPKITILPPPLIAGQEYRHQIATSLIEDVTINICRSRTFSVVAPHTALQLSVSGKTALFKTFGVDYAIETQLQNRGGEFWLAVKVLNAVSREITWTEHYAFDQEPAARHYRELSMRIFTSVVDKVERVEIANFDTEQKASAYHLYLSGQRYLRQLDLPNVRRARRAFRAAMGVCPDFVPGVSGLARTLRLEWVLLARGDPDLLVEAERLAARSIDLDPDDARGYRELGACTLYSGRFDESLQALGDAELRNPQFADLLMDYGDALTHACEPGTGLEKINRAIELNPLCPDQYWWAAGGANFHLQNYVEAIRCIERMQDQTPAYRLLAASYAMLGQKDRASEFVRETMEFHPDFKVSDWLSILPIRRPEYARHYEDGLRQAGFS